MITQVRIYTINRGMMDSWIKVFTENIVPNSRKYGINIMGAWVNRRQNEFIWMRSFESEEKLRIYETSPERTALGDRPGSHIAKIEVRDVEPAYEPAAAPA